MVRGLEKELVNDFGRSENNLIIKEKEKLKEEENIEPAIGVKKQA